MNQPPSADSSVAQQCLKNSEKLIMTLKINSCCQVFRQQRENLSTPQKFNELEDCLILSFHSTEEATAGPLKEVSSAPPLASLCSGQAARQQPISPRVKMYRNQIGFCITWLGTDTGAVSSTQSTAADSHVKANKHMHQFSIYKHENFWAVSYSSVQTR